MIVDLGVAEMVKLLKSRSELNLIIEEAHQVKNYIFTSSYCIKMNEPARRALTHKMIILIEV